LNCIKQRVISIMGDSEPRAIRHPGEIPST